MVIECVYFRLSLSILKHRECSYHMIRNQAFGTTAFCIAFDRNIRGDTKVLYIYTPIKPPPIPVSDN